MKTKDKNNFDVPIEDVEDLCEHLDQEGFKAPNSKLYTANQVAEALIILHRVDYNISQAREITGISYPTLKNWNQKYGAVVRRHLRDVKTMAEDIKTIDIASQDASLMETKSRESYLQDLYRVRTDAVTKLQELVPKIKSTAQIPMLVQVLQFIKSEEDGQSEIHKGLKLSAHFNQFIGTTVKISK